jgi:hypothetical protein
MLILGSEHSQDISKFLRTCKELIKGVNSSQGTSYQFKPAYFITDHSHVERKGIRDVFSADTEIFLGVFHTEKLFEQFYSYGRGEVFKLLRAALYSHSMVKAVEYLYQAVGICRANHVHESKIERILK